MIETEQNSGLYQSEFEHDACGIGFRAHLKGRKSHSIVTDAIQMLERMDHRGACGCDPNTGDGAGLLLQIPHEFFVSECRSKGFKLPAAGQYGVGQIFFPYDAIAREECREIFNRKIEELNLELLGYRKVPTLNDKLGEGSLKVEPWVEQVFIKMPTDIEEDIAFERKLYVLRQFASAVIRDSVKGVSDTFYVSSLSCKTISYKGQLTTDQLKYYFPDLQDKKVVSAFAIVHSRFSTNTFPSWKLAQPFRFIAHNGEINTVKGNVNWIRAAEKSFYSEFFTKEEMEMIMPICDKGNSDSAMLDNAIELLYLSGRSLPHVMMMMLPEAWDGNETMDPVRKAFYEYHATIMEPWDGPASISFTDGKIVGATLDRNGLRPSRYWVLNDDTVVMASEAGVLDIDQSKVVSKGRLQPGRMFVVDMEQGRIIPDEELKAKICSRQPYAKWITKYKINIKKLPKSIRPYTHYSPKKLLSRQISAGYTSEDLRMIIGPMGSLGKEAIGSMGIDTPLAILSSQSQHLSSYFKQLFAQVTNPPIDSIRERSIMSLISFVGTADNILTESPKHCRQVQLQQPVLTPKEFDKLRFVDQDGFQAKTINTYFFVGSENPGEALAFGIQRICRYAEDAIRDGFEILVLSDRATDSEHAPIPSLLAVSAIHHHLIRKGLRGKAGLVVEAGDVWETHHYATLIGYGASGICSYLAFETLSQMNASGQIDGVFTDKELYANYIKAVNKELLKIFSKMGISTLQSYQGAQIFECLGLNKTVVDKYFTGTVSRIGGLNIHDLAKEAVVRHRVAFPETSKSSVKRLEVGGVYQWKQRGEKHMFNPETIHFLQQSSRVGEKDLMEGYKIFKKYSKAINDQSKEALTLRSLMQFKQSESIPLEEVEPIENIFKRFATGAMSFGSISWEAHTTLAIAMNRIGGSSNSGEGGEDEIRYAVKENGDNLSSKIKQVASGRFGVT
ncbi:MAG: glutamate synthase (NADPH/NADH) large chain, partial [Arcticibacterium sp.]